MSTRVMDCCWGLQLAPSEKSVLMSLADQANDAGVCWPGVASLCERTCLSERTVQRALRALEDAGLMVCAVGAMKSNRYTLNVPLLKQMERDREAAKGEAAALRQASLDLAEQAPMKATARVSMGVMVTGCHGDTGAMVTPQGCHGDTQTVIEPIQRDTPHTPQALPGGRKALAGACAESAPLLTLTAWLESVQTSGGFPIPEGDEVWDYAAAVGLPAEYVVLCWREFKRRQARAKRQRDWRERFRRCVAESWYGLWLLEAGRDARLSTPGEQAARFFAAQDQAAGEEVAA